MNIEIDTTKVDGIKRGHVVDNNDPSKFGRIKVTVYGVFDDQIPVADLPWAVPAMPIFTGSGSGYGYFSVPKIGSWVWVFFEEGDIWQPTFFAEAPSAVHGLPTDRLTNYPNRHVMKTPGGITIYIDETASEIKVTHPAGAYLKIDSSGNVTIKGNRVDLNP